MKRFLLTSLLLLFFCNSAVIAQDAFADQRKELLSLLQQIEDAINSKDLSAVEEHIRPNTIMIFQDATVAVGFEKINDYFQYTVGAADSVVRDIKFEASIGAPAEFYAENLAVAFGNIDADFDMRAGNSFKLDTVWTTTVVKEADVWTVASLHFSNNLFDNPILNASQSFAWALGAGALVLGLILGLLFMWLKKRPARQ